MGKKDALSARDWIKAGFRALSAGGPQAIRAEAIARALKVSKGSFYWHFRDVAALKEAMLAHWVENATTGTIALVQSEGRHATDRLRRLVVIATNDRERDYGGPLVEMAIRDWGRYDPKVFAVVRKVELARLAFLREDFAAAGADAEQALRFGKLFYAGLIGLQQLSGLDDRAVGHDLAALLDLLLAEIA